MFVSQARPWKDHSGEFRGTDMNGHTAWNELGLTGF